VTIQIRYGNLVKSKSDFIVNASNTELILGSGVSRAFRKHCGELYQQKVYEDRRRYRFQYGEIRQGDVVSGGTGTAKNFQFALHVAVMNFSDSSLSSYPTKKLIMRGLKNVRASVEALSQSNGIQNPSLAIPLVGTVNRPGFTGDCLV